VGEPSMKSTRAIQGHAWTFTSSIALLVATASAWSCGGAATVEKTPVVPDKLTVSAPAVVGLKARGVGVQKYVCKAQKDKPDPFGWVFVAPEAELFDASGKKLGKHYDGPTWEALDGGKVVGALKEKVDSPDADAIPWLLLDAKASTGPGPFGQTKYIQRIATVGGKAPAAGCNESAAGTEVRIPYSADYYFYVDRT